MSKRLPARGVCRLTGGAGNFVNSHILPQAFTRATLGEGFICGGEGSRPKRSWSSWYDPGLVIKKGEEILARYDNWGVKQLRKTELVWSGWGNKKRLPIDSAYGVEGSRYGIRQLDCTNPAMLRLFFLSLLWRAAATTLPEFHAVQLPPQDLERLRKMLVAGNPEPSGFYPISLLQIVTRGPAHNLAPIAKDLGPLDVNGVPAFKTFRFYFDGLIVHVHRPLMLRTLARFPNILSDIPRDFRFKHRSGKIPFNSRI